MPIIDFDDLDQYDAAIAFLARRGMAFHTRPPQKLAISSEDYKALEDAKSIPGLSAKVNGARGKRTGSSPKSETGGTR